MRECEGRRCDVVIKIGAVYLKRLGDAERVPKNGDENCLFLVKSKVWISRILCILVAHS